MRLQVAMASVDNGLFSTVMRFFKSVNRAVLEERLQMKTVQKML
jgi:hypothetical protein